MQVIYSHFLIADCMLGTKFEELMRKTNLCLVEFTLEYKEGCVDENANAFVEHDQSLMVM